MKIALYLCIASLAVLAAGLAAAAPFDDLNQKLELPPRQAEADLNVPLEDPPPEKLEAPQRPELEPSEKPSDALVAARLAFQQKNFAQCLELLIVASAQHPSLPPPRLVLADMYLHNDMRLSGRALMERVAVEDPDHPELYRLFGSLALAERRWTEAVMHFRRALELPPPASWSDAQRQAFVLSSRKGLIAAAEQRGDWRTAAAVLSEIVEMAPGNAGVRDRWASALFHAGMTERAYEQFKVSRLLDRNMSPPELSMGILYIHESNYQQADAWFARAIAVHPNNAMLHYQIAVAMMVQDRAKDAASHAAQAAALGLVSADLNMLRGYAARQLNVLDAAERYFSLALAQQPNDATAKNQLALSLVELADEAKHSEALKLARSLAQADRESAAAMATLGWVQYRLGNIAEAEALLAKAADDAHLGPEPLYLIGRFYHEQGRSSQAETIALRLAAQLPRPGIFVARPAARQWLQEVAGKRSG